MKKKLLISLIFPLSLVTSQFALADNSDIQAPAANSQSTPVTAPSWLGVWIENIPVALGKHLSSVLKQDQGVFIKKVSPDSPAARAGLQDYDIISSFNQQEIYSQQQLTHLIQAQPSGSKVPLKIIRQGQELSLEVVLAALPRQKTRALNTHHPVHKPAQTWHQFPPALPNDPLLNSAFNRNFNRQFMHDMNQLRQQMFQLQQQVNQHGSQSNWSEFESIQIESTGNNKHRAAVKYEDSQGNKKEFVFEGNMNEIKQQILAQQEMNDDKKQSLLKALDMNNNYPAAMNSGNFMLPGWFNRP